MIEFRIQIIRRQTSEVGRLIIGRSDDVTIRVEPTAHYVTLLRRDLRTTSSFAPLREHRSDVTTPLRPDTYPRKFSAPLR